MAEMHLKKTKKKKILDKNKIFNILFFISIILISYLVSLKFIANKKEIKSEEYVNLLLDESYDKKVNYTFVVNESLKLLSKIDLKNPVTLLDNKIQKVNVNNFKKDKKEIYQDEEEYDSNLYDKVTSYISNSNNISDNPILYIYNTHQLETYSNLGIESSGISPNVMMASYLLKEKLDKKGVKTIVEDTNMAEFIRVSGITSNQFYGSSRIFMQNAVKKYPSLKYFIDLHRDSIDKNISTINIGNKNYARILFVIGVSNETYAANEELSKKISDKINEKYPKLSRGIYERVTSDWKEAYNQDLSENAILIELGAKDNTMEEVLNTIDALSEILPEFIKEK